MHTHPSAAVPVGSTTFPTNAVWAGLTMDAAYPRFLGRLLHADGIRSGSETQQPYLG